MRREDIINFWGQTNLLRWPEERLKDVAIPPASKSFLAEVGLPCGVDWTFRFDIPTVLSLPARPQFRQIGFDDVMPICLDEAMGGRVVAVGSETKEDVFYINSCIESFGVFLVLYQQYRTSVRTTSESGAQELIATAENLMRRTDPTAFDLPNNWWPLIIEQMSQGLL